MSGRSGSGVVTVGETMALLTTPAGRQLRGGASLPVGIGGAESNVAIGLARLGQPVTWVSRVGDDAFGSLVVREIRGEGVDVVARVDADAPTGLMVKELRHGRPWRVRYHRAGSAASRLSPADLDPDLIAAARVLHLTGITAALSGTALAAVDRAVDLARRFDTLVSFDVNHRTALWSDDRARPVLADLCARADLVFAGAQEAALVLGESTAGDRSDDPDNGDDADADADAALAHRLVARGPGTVVLKRGARGALAVTDGTVVAAPALPVAVVDPVGAGDAFVAGYLAALLDDRPVADRLRQGNRVAGAVCRVPGDWEGLPDRTDLDALDVTEQDVIR